MWRLGRPGLPEEAYGISLFIEELVLAQAQQAHQVGVLVQQDFLIGYPSR
ncbi:MAG: hypothetical protein R3B47_14430 [Bacteroidia bacterium]